MYFIIGVFVFTIVCLIVGLVGGLLYLIYLPFKRKLINSGKLDKKVSHKINIAYIAFLGLFSLYHTYTAFFPTDSFYKDEFVYNTGIDFPESGIIQKKDSWYPDLHGDYWSAAIAEFPEEDYEKLYGTISSSEKFEVDTTRQGIGITADFQKLVSHIPKEDIEIVYVKKRGEWFKVAFLKDKKTIIFERSSS
jgi:hypothetical protein